MCVRVRCSACVCVSGRVCARESMCGCVCVDKGVSECGTLMGSCSINLRFSHSRTLQGHEKRLACSYMIPHIRPDWGNVIFRLGKERLMSNFLLRVHPHGRVSERASARARASAIRKECVNMCCDVERVKRGVVGLFWPWTILRQNG